jgi:hypothetical protein
LKKGGINPGWLSDHFIQAKKSLAIHKMLKQMCFRDIGITGLKPVFFACPGNHIERSVIIDLDNFPKLIYHIMIFLTMFERIYLLCPGARTKRSFGLMVNNFITDPELLYHLDLLSG